MPALSEDDIWGTELGSSWAVHFQDGTPFPRTVQRPVDELAERLHGDLAFHWASKGYDSLDDYKRQFAPTWNMLSALPTKVVYPTKQLTITKDAAAKYHFPSPYDRGVWVHTPMSGAKDWEIHTGAIFQALEQAGATKQLVDTMWRIKPVDTLRTLHIRFSQSNGYWLLTSEAPPKWTSAQGSSPNQRDYASVGLPEDAWNHSSSYDISAHPNLVYLAVHLKADHWHTSADRWLINYADPVNHFANHEAPTIVGIPNANQELIADWAPLKPDKYPDAIQDYKKRVAFCEDFSPYEVDKHWPIVSRHKSFAGLYGHNSGGHELPNAHFASADLTGPHLGVKATHASLLTYERLHEGMDVNWTYHPHYIDPSYQGILGNSPAEYCYGQAMLIDSLEYPLPCDHELVELCGDEALVGCNPWDRAGRQLKKCKADMSACEEACTSWYTVASLGLSCVGGCGYDLAKTAVVCGDALLNAADELVQYVLGPMCLAFTGEACSDHELVIFKKRDAEEHREIEIEMEYRAASGMTKGEDYWCDSWIDGACDWNQDKRFNNVLATGSTWPKICVGMEKDFRPTGASNTGANQSECGFFEDKSMKVNPFVFAPGAMHYREEWRHRVATVLGDVGTFDPSKQSIPIAYPSANTSNLPNDWAFRLEFLGDAIIDCGHNPLRSELHPPSNVLMHLSTPDMVHVKRYSLFGWDRGYDNQDQSAPFDLWPGPPEKGKTKLAYRIVFPTGGSGTPAANLSCSPYPSAAPNRIRCEVKKGSVHGTPHSCSSSNSNRLFASCATAMGGGIVDVYWE